MKRRSTYQPTDRVWNSPVIVCAVIIVFLAAAGVYLASVVLPI